MAAATPAPRGIVLDWNRIFTGLVGVGAIAVAGFLVASWNLAADVKAMRADVDTMNTTVGTLATKADVEKTKADAVAASKVYTDREVSGVRLSLAEQKQTLAVVKEDVKEIKADQRTAQKETTDLLKNVQKSIHTLELKTR